MKTRATIFSSLALLGCSAGETAESGLIRTVEQEIRTADEIAIDDYIRAGTVITAPPDSTTVVTESDSCEDINGTQMQCRYSQVHGEGGLDEQISFDPNSASLFAGSLVYGSQLDTGLLANVTLPRADGTVTMTGVHCGSGNGAQPCNSLSRSGPMTLAGVTDARMDILNTNPIYSTAVTSYTDEDVYTYEEAQTKFEINGKISGTQFEALFDRNYDLTRTSVAVRFEQAYYTMNFSNADHPHAVFPTSGADALTPDEIYDAIPADETAAYVSSVKYGRLLYLHAESSASSTELKLALEVAIKQGSAALDHEQQEIINSSTLRLIVLGGDPTQAVEIINDLDELESFIVDGAQFSPNSPGAPISYTVNHLADNSVISVAYSHDYLEPNCSTNMDDITVRFDRVKFHKDGDRIGKGDNGYKVCVKDHWGEQQQCKEEYNKKHSNGGTTYINFAPILHLPQVDGTCFEVYLEAWDQDGKIGSGEDKDEKIDEKIKYCYDAAQDEWVPQANIGLTWGAHRESDGNRFEAELWWFVEKQNDCPAGSSYQNGCCMPTNLALSASVSAKSTFPYGNYSTSRVNDGDRNTAVGGPYSWVNGHTYATNGTLPQWLDLAFGSAQPVGRVELYTSAGYPIRDYDVQVRVAGNWQTKEQVRGNTDLHVTSTFAPVNADAVRILALAGPTNQGVYTRINEVEAYAF